jgi:hypothetical protein
MEIEMDPSVVDLATLCARAYSDPPTYGKPDGAGRAHVYDGVVVFRGTDDPASLLIDLDVETVTVPDLGTLHAGFWSAFGEIAGDLMKLSPQIIAGHSLGGALALIYAGELCRAGHAPSAVYAFEPPRLAMDNTLRDLLDAHGVMRFCTRNGLDPVTEVPSWMSLPANLSSIGRITSTLDLISYHKIEAVISSLA